MTNEKEFRQAAKIIPKTNFVLSEFMAMLAGEKPAVVITLKSTGEEKFIIDNFPDLFIAIGHGPWYKENATCAISRNKESAKLAANYLNVDIIEQGRVLGYPDCCCKQHQHLIVSNKALDSSFVVFKTYRSTNKCSYLTNNLFNFCSRLGTNQANFNNLNQYHKLNKNVFTFFPWNLQYISHIPYRYDCPKSIKIGREIRLILKKYAPLIEEKINYSLAKPILFFDLFNLIVFNGFFKDNTINYSQIIPPFFPLANPLIKYIKRGNRIMVSDDKITIYNKNIELFIYKKKNERDDFVLDFKQN